MKTGNTGRKIIHDDVVHEDFKAAIVCAMTALLEQAKVYRNRLTEELTIISITSHMLTNPIDFSFDTK